MKNLVIFLTIIPFQLLIVNCFAQAPELFNYQGVARDNSGSVLADQNIGLQLTLRSGSANGTIVYRESQSPTTNQFGLFNIQIGNGIVVSGDMSAIDWGGNSYYMQVEMDPSGGASYLDMGTSQLLSVPYALFAENSSNTWSRLGNAGTVDGTNFIGTTDDAPLNIRVNNEKAGRIDNALANTFFGYQSGNSNTTGTWNSANGNQALYSNTEGFGNTANGKFALHSNTTGAWNTAIGVNTLYSNTTGVNNTANGNGALYSNTGGGLNTANGSAALQNNTIGSLNCSTGNHALSNNTSGNGNTANGNEALYTNNGSSNTAVGNRALYLNDVGNNNTATGVGALRNNIADNNTATGYQTLYGNTDGDGNVANGYRALFFNTEGSDNTANGYQALYSNNTGFNNSANGFQALYSNTTGSSNTANGSEALYSNTTGDFNTANGNSALYSNTTGDYNTAIGVVALANNTAGSYNTAIGQSAFEIGAAYINSTALGYNTGISASNAIRLGNNVVSSIGGYANWSNVSDGRFKVDVQENVVGLDFIKKLRPVTYHLDMNAIAAFNKIPDNLRLPESEKLKAAELQVGFIAQEVETAAKELNFDFHGVDAPKNETSHYGLRYAEFAVPLVKAIQEQQELIEILMLENKQMKDDLAQIRSMLNEGEHE